MENAVVWFDIPVTDMARAKKFYSTIFAAEFAEMPGSSGTVVFFPMDPDSVGGDLALGENQVPSTQGCTVYLNGGEDLSLVLDRVEPAGGKILTPKSFMGDMVGNIAYFLDTEGNRIGLHSTK
jgi:predicted enzyme related to lactoylglutathione lyase